MTEALHRLYLSTGASPCTESDARFIAYARAATPAEAEERAASIAELLKVGSVAVHTDCTNTINVLPIDRGSFVLWIDDGTPHDPRDLRRPWSAEEEARFFAAWQVGIQSVADIIQGGGWWSYPVWRSVVGQEDGWDPFAHDTIPHAQAWLMGRRHRRCGRAFDDMPAACGDQDYRIEWARGWTHEDRRIAAADDRFPDAPDGPHSESITEAEDMLEVIAERLGVDVKHALDGRSILAAIEENKGARADKLTVRLFEGAEASSYALDWLERGRKATFEDASIEVVRREDNSLDVRLVRRPLVNAIVEAVKSAGGAGEAARLRTEDSFDAQLARFSAVRRPSVDAQIWQCSGCKNVYLEAWRPVCPGCGRVDFWTGSVRPEDVERARQRAGGHVVAQSADVGRVEYLRGLLRDKDVANDHLRGTVADLEAEREEAAKSAAEAEQELAALRSQIEALGAAIGLTDRSWAETLTEAAKRCSAQTGLERERDEVRGILLARYEDDPTDGEDDTSLSAVARHVSEDWASDMAKLADAEEAASDAGLDDMESPAQVIELLAGAGAKASAAEEELAALRARATKLEKLQAEERVEADRQLVEILGEWAGISDDGTNEDVRCLLGAYEAVVHDSSAGSDVLRAILGLRSGAEALAAAAESEALRTPYAEDIGLTVDQLAGKVRDRLSAVYRERNIAVAITVRLAHDLGWRAGTYADPEAPGWPVASITPPGGLEITWHLTADIAKCLPTIPRCWDGHTKAEAEARLLKLAVMGLEASR